MKSWKKAGLTALAGSLVAFSSAQAEWSASGSASMTYVTHTGTTGDTELSGSPFGMNKDITVSGSGELDNGWVVSASHTVDNGDASNSSLTVNFGAAGTLKYNMVDGSLGAGKIDNVMPTAYEEASDGSTTGALSQISNGATGFDYTITVEGIEVGIGYAPKGTNGSTTQGGGVGGAGSGASEKSIYAQGSPMDGLTIGAGIGEGQADSIQNTDDESTMFVTYAYGPVTVGYQKTDIDKYNTTNDIDVTYYGVAYAINDDLSVSYNKIVEDTAGTAYDTEYSGVSVGYSMGGMAIKAYINEETGHGSATQEVETTEISLSFAF
jgi:outer membrane protein OmpU